MTSPGGQLQNYSRYFPGFPMGGKPWESIGWSRGIPIPVDISELSVRSRRYTTKLLPVVLMMYKISSGNPNPMVTIREHMRIDE